ncbi:hypothetical protein BU52_28880 [Streptomyces toyocaensis]|uniref:HTH cro/C1-type domain-containing protein n=2 Tax=Streptomyces toyocaensis TaxID=55952 RepID=A0A081XJK8_STRTO|nr:hypothetical protein BU52_28880 [Streptomyces toyocaensis]
MRLLAGWSQARLASELGYHHSVISRWETGDRNPPLHQLGRIDEVLRTGGRLTELYRAAGEDRCADPWPYAPPSASSHAPGGDSVLPLSEGSWPARLPHHGVACPSHGTDGCAVPSPERAESLWRAFTANPSSVVSEDVIHMLAAYLAVEVRRTEIPNSVSGGPTVEEAMRLITGGWHESGDRPNQSLTRLTAGYASLCGQLRMLRGQPAAAMAFYERGLRWALRCDDTALKATILCDMNALARFEHDGASAVGHARALLSFAGDISWVRSLACLHLARGYAILGDARETVRLVARSRAALEDSATNCGPRPDWITGDQGRAWVEAGIGGALRDASVTRADRGLAREALDATERSKSLVPVGQRPAAVLLGLRLADCHACAGRPDTAAYLASPLLAEALTATRTTVSHELRGLLGRLAPHQPHLTSAHALSIPP